MLVAGLLGVLVGCGSSGSALAPGPAVADPGNAEIYTAVGASETVGAGIDDNALRLRDEWPQLFFNAGLPRATTFVNLGIPGATTATALAAELPEAVRLRPTVATVWLNVDDLVAGVPVAEYESQLRTLVRGLRQLGRAIVLVANTPVLDDLPAYQSCRSQGPCILGPSVTLPAPEVVRTAVDAYNAAIARVVSEEKAVLVDLHSQGSVASLHPEWIGSDGFHPSFQGHAQVARLFVAAYQASRRH